MVREGCCRNRCGWYMSGGCWEALWAMRRIQMGAGSHHERSRLGSAATVRDAVQGTLGVSRRAGAAQATAMSLI